MKKLKVIVPFFVIALFITSCSIEQEPIEYGKDMCHLCMMTIVERQYGAEIVTTKGKVFKYDAIECLVRDVNTRDENEIALFLITDYLTPGQLVDATTSTYLISENLPSPMGADLTGFANKEDAVKMLEEKGGKLFTWDELKRHFIENMQ